ncbi:MAG: hypothetical protein JO301_04965 [Chitinophagaceae bacterium]|nr:hypothetical protein [Chitinophagaceae bacterium]
MEVPHTHRHEKKNWKSYLGEFFMLFLAVFSGFVAENLREGYVEKEKGHQYVQSMISDLETDTLKLQQVANANRKLLKGIDSLLLYIKAPASDSTNKQLYRYGSYVAASILFESANGTITQLKNAGGLRLIRDTASVNRITAYDALNEMARKQSDAYYKGTLDLLNVMEQIMDFSVALRPVPGGFFIDRDPVKMRMFYNKSYMQKQIIAGYAGYLNLLKAEATHTLQVLRKDYHLETTQKDTTVKR